MTLAIDFQLDVGDAAVSSEAILSNLDTHRSELEDISTLEGEIIFRVGDSLAPGSYSDPFIRLTDAILRKVPWIISGDTETVALRNSEHCYAFVPAGDGVEISLFEGDEAEIEEYVFEPTAVRLEDFATQCIALGENVLALIKNVDESLLENNEDCRELQASLEEAQRAWKDHQLHQRR